MCDSHFLTWLDDKLVTVLYLSIIDVFWLKNLCGMGGDASFAPEANLVFCLHYDPIIMIIQPFVILIDNVFFSDLLFYAIVDHNHRFY